MTTPSTVVTEAAELLHNIRTAYDDAKYGEMKQLTSQDYLATGLVLMADSFGYLDAVLPDLAQTRSRLEREVSSTKLIHIVSADDRQCTVCPVQIARCDTWGKGGNYSGPAVYFDVDERSEPRQMEVDIAAVEQLRRILAEELRFNVRLALVAICDGRIVCAF